MTNRESIEKIVYSINTKYSNLTLDNLYEKDKTFTLALSGGLNGTGDWRDYLVDIQELVDNLYEISSYVAISDLITDILDDVFYLTVKVEF